MALLGPIAFIAIVISMLFIWLAQRERMSTSKSSRRRFKPDWARTGGTTRRRRRRISFRR